MDINRVEECMRFYLTATKLKELMRSGWDNKHWNVLGRVESVAEHVYGTMILAISIYSNFKIDINLDKVLKMLCLHEIGEVVIGDITPYEGITVEEKQEREHAAIKDVLGDLFTKDEYYNLLEEFDAHVTNESKFAYMCDKMEADIKAKVYQDKGEVRKLNDPKIAMKDSPRFKAAIEAGDKEMFDVWYRYDKDKFEDDPIFKSILEYIKDNNTNI